MTPTLGKLLVFATLGRKAYGERLFQRLLARLMALVCALLIGAILAAGLLIGWLLAAHTALLQYGVGPLVALLAISSITLLIIILLGLLARHHLRALPRTLPQHSPIISRINAVAYAFLDGLMEK